MQSVEKAIYDYCEEKHGRGMFFFTDCCGNRMYSVNSDKMAYHRALCPRCYWEGRKVVLYLRGTVEADKVLRERSLSE